MDEEAQQLLALGIVALAVGAELVRRYRKRKAGKVGCDHCDTPSGAKANSAGEAPVRFYKKR